MPIAPRCCSQLQLVCCCQEHHSAHWRPANRTMLPLLAAACLPQSAASLSASAVCRSHHADVALSCSASASASSASSALAPCLSHHAVALSCSSFAAASSTTQRTGALPIRIGRSHYAAPLSCMIYVCRSLQHHSAHQLSADRTMHAAVSLSCSASASASSAI